MSNEWTQTQRKGWLCKLYGTSIDDGTRALQHDTVQSQLLDVLDELISHKLPPNDAAIQTASKVLAQADVSTPWANIVGLVLNAAETFDDETVLQALIDYLAELASLPDAINDGPGVKTIDVGGGEIWHVQPGQTIRFAEGQLWRDLPMYSWNVTEHFQGEFLQKTRAQAFLIISAGPEQYLEAHGGSSTPLLAMQTWKKFNTFLALMAVHAKAQTIPVLAGKARLGLRALAMALENSPHTWLGRNSELHAPAAAQWLRIAGGEIERLCEAETERAMGGDLWESHSGAEVCDCARLAFWKSRLTDLGY